MDGEQKKLLKLLEVKINKITDDSRKIEKGDIYVAIRGSNFDGHSFIEDVTRKNVTAVVYEHGNYKSTKDIVFIKTTNTRRALSILAANFYDNAHKKMKLIGITGTNGKTTTSEITYQLLNKLSKKTGLLSTISAKTPKKQYDTGLHVTTPNVLELHKTLHTMYEEGCEFVVVETTSHGIDQYRTYGLEFEICAITNITPEHLDYHKTFLNYLNTKTKIFRQSKKVILNKWDPSLDAELKKLPKNKDCVIVDYKNIAFPSDYIKTFPGDYNLENAAIAYAIVEHLIGEQHIDILKNLKSVNGRMENIKNDKGIRIIIDFAHDHISLEKVLKEVRNMTDNKIVHVFGCAGLRDKLKRPKMGVISTKYADTTVVTAEDPRTEDLKQINFEIEQGIIQNGSKIDEDYFIIDDRQKAINLAINTLAKKGDTVIITGKGHEKSMCFGTQEYPWTDKSAVKKALKNKITAS